MKRLVVALVLCFALPAMAHAQATRTWVSGVGDDANPCSRTAPCKTFAGAIVKTAVGGEISALDPGGFGAVTITKAITLNGEGTLAGILSALTNGININAGAGDDVVIRNISINGAGSGLNGINVIVAGSVVVENVSINGLTGDGIHFAAAGGRLAVINTTISNAGNGIVATPGPMGSARVTVLGSRMLNNAGVGIKADGNATVTVRGTTASGNNYGFWASGSVGFGIMELLGCEASHNATYGVAAGLGSNFGAIRMTGTLVTGNGRGLFADSRGFIDSWGDNRVIDNGTNGSPSRILSTQ